MKFSRIHEMRLLTSQFSRVVECLGKFLNVKCSFRLLDRELYDFFNNAPFLAFWHDIF